MRILDRGPITSGELGKQLKAKFPTAEALSLSVLLQMSETLIQVPPTRIWGNGAAPLLTRVENWLPPARPAVTRTDLVRRYLAAYGPASINDMQIWCRLTKLSAEFRALDSALVVFQGEDGRVLYDLPDAPRPAADTPAPVSTATWRAARRAATRPAGICDVPGITAVAERPARSGGCARR